VGPDDGTLIEAAIPDGKLHITRDLGSMRGDPLGVR